jgi:hypothetical protein
VRCPFVMRLGFHPDGTVSYVEFQEPDFMRPAQRPSAMTPCEHGPRYEDHNGRCRVEHRDERFDQFTDTEGRVGQVSQAPEYPDPES